MVRRVWEPSFRSTGVQVRTWPKAAPIRSPGESAYWGTPAAYARAREAVGVAEFDPKRTKLDFENGSRSTVSENRLS